MKGVLDIPRLSIPRVLFSWHHISVVVVVAVVAVVVVVVVVVTEIAVSAVNACSAPQAFAVKQTNTPTSFHFQADMHQR